MQDNNSTVLKLDELNAFQLGELEHIISQIQGTLTLEVPCPAIGSTQSYRDIAFDLLTALFVGENVVEFCKDASLYEGWNEGQACKTYNFVLIPQDSVRLAEKLYWLADIFDEEEEREGEVFVALSDFQDRLGLHEKQTYHFSQLVDDYFANYIVGLGEDSYTPEDIAEIDRDDLAQVQRYIHEKYSYIQSVYQGNLAHDLYFSTEDATWIILSNSSIEITELSRLLKIFREHVPQPFELQESVVVITDVFDTIVFNQVEAVYYPFEKLTKAQDCTTEIYGLKSGMIIDKLKATVVKENLLSNYGNVLLVADQMAQYIFFEDSLPKLPKEMLEKSSEISPRLKAFLDNREVYLKRRLDEQVPSRKDVE